ncbi:polyphosphate polymerase domain-containing protein [candidate division KSB1 bacterium]|nr:polyphosphate polymerase domain-containing protein [candidate division KSB1 bacterium]
MSAELENVRYELKYTITEELAGQIREHIQNICVLDSHVVPGERSYIVNNLYFDTPDLKFYYDTKFRKLTRFKVRLRYYGEQSNGMVWPEIKYRNANMIWKRRYGLPIERWSELFHGSNSTRREPIIKDQVDTFDELIDWYGARSILHVRYDREPYVTELDNYGRITFDRDLSYRPTRGSIDLAYQEQDMLYYDDPVTSRSYDSPVILEIKVEPHIPSWVINLIAKFNLKQRGFSKYCYGIDNIMGFNDNGRISIFDNR